MRNEIRWRKRRRPPMSSPTRFVNFFTVEHPEQFPLAVATAHPSTSELSRHRHRHSRYFPQCPGRLARFRPRRGNPRTAGRHGKKGQLLLTIRSDDVSGGFDAYRKAVADELLARKQLDRAKDLYGHGAMAYARLSRSLRMPRTDAKIDAGNRGRTSSPAGNDPGKPMGMVDIFAPISGVITDQQVTNAAAVQSVQYSESFHDFRSLVGLDCLRCV